MRKAGRELSLSLAPTASQLQAAEQELSRLTAPSENRIRERKVRKMRGHNLHGRDTA